MARAFAGGSLGCCQAARSSFSEVHHVSTVAGARLTHSCRYGSRTKVIHNPSQSTLAVSTEQAVLRVRQSKRSKSLPNRQFYIVKPAKVQRCAAIVQV